MRFSGEPAVRVKRLCGRGVGADAAPRQPESFVSLFFASLSPGEWTRFLYIDIVMQLCAAGAIDIDSAIMLRTAVAVLLVRLSLTRGAAQRLCMQRVVQQAVQLQRQGVPRQRLIVVKQRGHDDDNAAAAAVVRYEPDFVDLLARDLRHIAVVGGGDIEVTSTAPRYECLDAKRDATAVCRRLAWSRDQLRQRYEALGLIRPWQARLVGDLVQTLSALWFCLLDLLPDVLQ